jgi:hypothetical protein
MGARRFAGPWWNIFGSGDLRYQDLRSIANRSAWLLEEGARRAWRTRLVWDGQTAPAPSAWA